MDAAQHVAVAADRPGRPPAGAPVWPRPVTPRLPAWLLYRVQRLLAPNAFYRVLAKLLESLRLPSRLFTAAEKAVKSPVFGCRMCAQCALPATGYACPMTCPKQLRNGPCGGVAADGGCEVYPGMRCVWVVAYERAAQQGRTADLTRLQRPIDQREWGRSSWVSYWLSRDDDLWTADDGMRAAPAIWRAPVGGRR